MQVRADTAKSVKPPFNLQIESGYVGWKKAVKIERIALSIGKRRAFVQKRIVQQLVAASCSFENLRTLKCDHGFVFRVEELAQLDNSDSQSAARLEQVCEV